MRVAESEGIATAGIFTKSKDWSTICNQWDQALTVYDSHTVKASISAAGHHVQPTKAKRRPWTPKAQRKAQKTAGGNAAAPTRPKPSKPQQTAQSPRAAPHSHEEQTQPQSPLQLLCEPPNTSPQNPVRQKQTTLDSTLPAHAKRAHALAEAEANEAEPSTPAAEQTTLTTLPGWLVSGHREQGVQPSTAELPASSECEANTRCRKCTRERAPHNYGFCAEHRTPKLAANLAPSAQRKLQFHAAV